MLDFAQVDCWIRQAEADLRAGGVASIGIEENHRRYWLQQSCEKAIKAWGLLHWAGGGNADDEKDFVKVFLKQHAPYDEIQSATQPVPQSVYKLRREIYLFLNSLDNSKMLEKLDATKPFFDPSQISYRYPFLDGGRYVAPSEYGGWDAYQGNVMGVAAAVDRLIKAVRADLKKLRRAPG
jgi:hypothetical protein